MSETEIHIGKLLKLDLTGNIEEKSRSILDTFGKDKLNYHKSYFEAVEDILYRKIVFFKGDFYHVIKDESYESCGDIAESSTNSDGIIDFIIMYYNGGATFDEVVVAALHRLDRD